MKKYYKLFFLPAIIIIIAGIFSGFSKQSCDQVVESLLEERTSILQKAYYGKIDEETAEKSLAKIETYPLLSEDIQGLRNSDPTQLDIVKSMELRNVTQSMKMFDYISYQLEIRWYMSGLSADYVCDNEYSVVVKSTNSGYKLSEFNPI